MEDKVPIFLMFHNNAEWTNLCLEYLRKNTEESTYRLILINNGSTDRQKKIVEANMIDGDVLVSFDNSVVVAFGYNFAIENHLDDSEYFVILHNDVFVSHGWLDRMKAHADSYDDFSAIFPRANYCTEGTPSKYDEDLKENFLKFKTSNKVYVSKDDILKVVEKTYEEFDGFDNFTSSVGKSSSGMMTVSDELCCFCTLFKSENYFKYGKFDEDFVNYGGEIKIFNYKCYEDCIYSILAMDVFVHHNGNTTTDFTGHNFQEEKEQSDMLFLEKSERIRIEKMEKTKLNTSVLGSQNTTLFVIRDDGIGDIIMSLFSLSWIKKVIKNVEITYATRPEFMEFVSGFDCVDSVVSVIAYRKSRIQSDLLDEIDKVSKYYEDKFDIVVNLIKYFEIFNKNDKRHRIEQVSSYVEECSSGVFSDIKAIYPQYRESFINFPFIGEMKDVGLKRVAISPDSTCCIRSLPYDVFLKIVEIESMDKQVFIFGKDKIDIKSEDINIDNVVNLSGKTNLEDLPPIIKSCEYVYTPDSGIFHIAGSLGVPCRAFFGSVDPGKRGGFYSSSGRDEIYYKEDLSCVPCNDIGCDSIRCMAYSDEEIERIVAGEPLNG